MARLRTPEGVSMSAWLLQAAFVAPTNEGVQRAGARLGGLLGQADDHGPVEEGALVTAQRIGRRGVGWGLGLGRARFAFELTLPGPQAGFTFACHG